MKLRRGQRGLSLIEVTIMLLVLMLLTSVLAPSIFDFINDAQWVKVKEDCEAIVVSLARLHKDVGPRLYTVNGGHANYPTYKLDVMYSAGNLPTLSALVAAAPTTVFDAGMNNWLATNYAAVANRVDTCEDQLITNDRFGNPGTAIYPMAGGPPTSLAWGQGWRGAYLSPPCGPDPWGWMYEVNTKWATTTFGTTFPGDVVNHCNDYFCLSPGKDGIIETFFGYDTGGIQSVHRKGDDFVSVLSPCDPW